MVLETPLTLTPYSSTLTSCHHTSPRRFYKYSTLLHQTTCLQLGFVLQLQGYIEVKNAFEHLLQKQHNLHIQ